MFGHVAGLLSVSGVFFYLCERLALSRSVSAIMRLPTAQAAAYASDDVAAWWPLYASALEVRMGALGVPHFGRRSCHAFRAFPTSHGTAFASVEILDSHGVEAVAAEEAAATLAFVAAQIVWGVSTVSTDRADQGDSGAL